MLKVLALVGCLLGSGYLTYSLSAGTLQKFPFFHEPPLAVEKSVTTPAAQLPPIVRLVTNDGRTFCSGTVITPNIILTAAHCVMTFTPFGAAMNTGPIGIRAFDNVDRKTTASAFFMTNQMDQALLRGDFKLFRPQPYITDPEKLEELSHHGRDFVSCGYPLNGDFYCSKMTFVQRLNFAWALEGLLIPGMSGGPTMLADGTVVGVNFAVEGKLSLVSPIYNVQKNFDLINHMPPAPPPAPEEEGEEE